MCSPAESKESVWVETGFDKDISRFPLIKRGRKWLVDKTGEFEVEKTFVTQLKIRPVALLKLRASNFADCLGLLIYQTESCLQWNGNMANVVLHCDAHGPLASRIIRLADEIQYRCGKINIHGRSL
jgi:hypothetical protein